MFDLLWIKFIFMFSRVKKIFFIAQYVIREMAAAPYRPNIKDNLRSTKSTVNHVQRVHKQRIICT